MSSAILCGVVIAVLAPLVVAAAIWQERREARKYGALRCPGCGVEFGPGAYTPWHAHINLGGRCRWESGPYLRCKGCGVGFRYTRSGELHPEQFGERPAPPTDRPA